jgi:phosphohistidine phosphatase
MSLYLIRHAHAVDADEDPRRPLSARGREQARTLANFLKATGALQTTEVWHSPLARSIETAELFVQHLGLDARLTEVDGLEGEDDPAIVAQRLARRHDPLAIVGHNPHLGALLSLLVAGSAAPPRFVVKKCAVIALDREGDRWLVRWHLSPEIAR